RHGPPSHPPPPCSPTLMLSAASRRVNKPADFDAARSAAAAPRPRGDSEAGDDVGDGLKMARHLRGGHETAAAGERERHDELIGEVRIDRSLVGVEELQELPGRAVAQRLGPDPALADQAEGAASVLED